MDNELVFSTIGEPLDWSNKEVKQTVCLLIADYPISDELLVSIVTKAINVGCTFFMTWGRMAEELHEKIDDVVENGSNEWLSILTTSHGDESTEDVLAFLFTGTFPGNKDFRCLIIGDRSIDELRSLILRN